MHFSPLSARKGQSNPMAGLIREEEKTLRFPLAKDIKILDTGSIFHLCNEGVQCCVTCVDWNFLCTVTVLQTTMNNKKKTYFKAWLATVPASARHTASTIALETSWITIGEALSNSEVAVEGGGSGSFNQCWGFVTFWCGSGDPYLWLMDPASFFRDFNDAKKDYFFPYFFLITYPQAHYLHCSSVLKI